MEPIVRIEGTALPLDRADVDTDQIIPAQYLKRIERTGFGAYLFDEWRKDPDFVLNDRSVRRRHDPARGRELRMRIEPRARAVGDRGPRVPGGRRAELRGHLPQQLPEDRPAPGRAPRGVGPRADGRGARRSDDHDRGRPGRADRARSRDRRGVRHGAVHAMAAAGRARRHRPHDAPHGRDRRVRSVRGSVPARPAPAVRRRTPGGGAHRRSRSTATDGTPSRRQMSTSASFANVTSA